jgi:hypothetical protein
VAGGDPTSGKEENQWPQQSRCADKAEEISAQRCFEKWHKHITFSVFGTELSSTAAKGAWTNLLTVDALQLIDPSLLESMVQQCSLVSKDQFQGLTETVILESIASTLLYRLRRGKEKQDRVVFTASRSIDYSEIRKRLACLFLVSHGVNLCCPAAHVNLQPISASAPAA